MTVKVGQNTKKFTKADVIASELRGVQKQIESLKEHIGMLRSGDYSHTLMAGLIQIDVEHLENHFKEYSTRIEKFVKVQ